MPHAVAAAASAAVGSITDQVLVRPSQIEHTTADGTNSAATSRAGRTWRWTASEDSASRPATVPERRERAQQDANQRHPERPAPPPPQGEAAERSERGVGGHLPRGHPIGGVVHCDAQDEGAESGGDDERTGVDGPVARSPGPHGVGMGRVAGCQHRRGGGLGPPSAKPGHGPSVRLWAARATSTKVDIATNERRDVGSGRPPFGHRIVAVRPMRRRTGRLRLAT